ncbi:hypothetical protein L682_12305 [Aquipseudomonas alcaligenes OT 69]|nr:hypothetical protein L682_12305 [Pseudomonas alcaligenes OT 69]
MVVSCLVGSFTLTPSPLIQGAEVKTKQMSLALIA